MKKKFKIITIIAIILILGIVILFCSKVNKISLIENIKQKISKTEEIQTANEVTTVDITDLEDNGNLEHEHIFKTMYDKTNHWKECTICGQKNNEVRHTFTSNWTSGTPNDCIESNILIKVCDCGYIEESIDERKAHNLIYINDSGDYKYRRYCTFCEKTIEILHECYTNGKRVNCLNLGKCSICDHVYKNDEVFHSYRYIINNNNNIDNNARCEQCNLSMGTINNCKLEKISSNTYKLYTSMVVPNDAIYTRTTFTNTFGNNVKIENDITRNGTTWNNVVTITFNGHNETYGRGGIANWYTINGRKYYIMIGQEFCIDNEKPTISSITMKNNEELTEWSKNKPIVISGTENYCNTVSVKITDEEENIIFEGSGSVTNQNYQLECIPEIECDTNGKTYIATVTDNCGNSTSKEFTIAKVDCIPPIPTSGTKILGDWAKSKNFTFTATDYGIGEVQVAFNDIKDLKLAKAYENTYSRDYTFTGDVYQPKQLSVMYKDGLENTSIQKITIDKIDNTVPNITNAELHNNKITVTSHDEHETLGEGSGVVKYRYLASEEKIENPVLTKENSTEVLKDEEIKIKDIYKMKYIYAVAEDYVGNISEVYEFKVPELKVTAIANSNTSNGKGEIILDWSSYDVTDKYFVVYRKKENQEYWEKIVPLEQKLTGNTYTDTLANDETNPNTPSITIISNATNNNINITPTATDNGSTYTYYIEAYDSTGILLSKSN